MDKHYCGRLFVHDSEDLHEIPVYEATDVADLAGRGIALFNDKSCETIDGFREWKKKCNAFVTELKQIVKENE